MEQSTTIVKLAGALLNFHSNMGKVVKGADNPFFKSKYAELPDIQDAIRQPLQEAGLVYSQLPDGESELTTMLIHAESGEYFKTTCNLHMVKQDPQAWGSSLTYAKRYSLVAILGLNVDKDDDGNAASQPQKQAKKDNVKPLTDDEFLAWSDTVKGVKTIEDLTNYFNKNKTVIESHPAIKTLFTKRKEELQKEIGNA